MYLASVLEDSVVLGHIHNTILPGGRFSIVSLEAGKEGEKLYCEVMQNGEIQITPAPM